MYIEKKKTRGKRIAHRGFGWDGWIRTSEMTESKSVALPLGDGPIYGTRSLIARIKLRVLCGVEDGIRTHGLQCHKLAL